MKKITLLLLMLVNYSGFAQFPLPYCGPMTFTSNVEPITLVNFAGINNSTSALVGPDNGTTIFAHEDYTAITGNVSAGGSYTITLQGNTDGNFTSYLRVYVDWNQNNDFTDAGESYDVGTIVNSTGADAIQLVGTILVPPTALLGTTRMRVIKRFSAYGTSCQTGTGYGQAEDYTLTVAPLPTDLPDYANLQYPPTATFQAGGNITVYGQVYEGGLTDVAPNIVGQAPGINSWIGISPVGSNTNPNTWTNWVPATWNSGSVGNNDEYQASIGATLPQGTYYYATRFQLNGGAFVYGGYTATGGGFWDGTTNISGVLTVTPPPSVTPNCDLVSSIADPTVGGFTWTRPVVSGASLSTIGVGISYHIYGPFTVDTTGSYTATSTQDYDGFILIYQNSFDPNDQLTNFVAANDDSGINVSQITTNLTTGTSYYLVTTSYSPTGFGNFTTVFTGAGTVTCNGGLAVPGFNDINFSYYPNPVKNTLNLSYDQEISSVEVYNLLGQKVSSSVINANDAHIDMSNLSKGAYMVRVTSKNQAKTIKIIKE